MPSKYEQFKTALLNATNEEHRATFFRKCNCHDRLCEMCVKGWEDEIPEEIRPITLEDIIIVLENIPKFSGGVLRVDTYGYLYRMDSRTPLLIDGVRIKWLLGKPAHQQSDETLEALIKLL